MPKQMESDMESRYLPKSCLVPNMRAKAPSIPSMIAEIGNIIMATMKLAFEPSMM